MSHRIEISDDKTGAKKTIIVIKSESTDQKCSECGAVTECRPYGHLGARICFDCGQKNLKRTTYNAAVSLFGMKGKLL